MINWFLHRFWCKFHIYTYGKLIFTDFDECESDPCMNGGTCVQDPSRLNFRQCTCVAGYTGVDCETGEYKLH